MSLRVEQYRLSRFMSWTLVLDGFRTLRGGTNSYAHGPALALCSWDEPYAVGLLGSCGMNGIRKILTPTSPGVHHATVNVCAAALDYTMLNCTL